MHPIVNFIFGVLSYLVCVIGGSWSTLALGGIATIAEIGALCVIPDTRSNGVGVWVVGQFSSTPAIVVGHATHTLLTEEELTAIMAHEVHHVSKFDRFHRTFANVCGGMLAPVCAMGASAAPLPYGVPGKMAVLFFAVVAPALQWYMLHLSEELADTQAILRGTDQQVLARAKQKLRDAMD